MLQILSSYHDAFSLARVNYRITEGVVGAEVGFRAAPHLRTMFLAMKVQITTETKIFLDNTGGFSFTPRYYMSLFIEGRL